MEIVRDNRFDGTFAVLLDADTDYEYVLIDEDTGEEVEGTGTSDVDGTLVIDIPSKFLTYDGSMTLYINDPLKTYPLVYSDNVDVVRPYCDIEQATIKLAGRATREEVLEYERIARTIINSFTGTSFGLTYKTISYTGNGTDYLPLKERVVSIDSVKENNEIVWETPDPEEFAIDPNNYALIRLSDDTVNRLDYPIVWKNRYHYPEFVDGFDYEITGEIGWRIVPQSLKDAALMLVVDIGCGTNKYSNKYISRFSSGSANITYDGQVFVGTGNAIVDKILSQYSSDSLVARVL